jgi:hypothetical protein
MKLQSAPNARPIRRAAAIKIAIRHDASPAKRLHCSDGGAGNPMLDRGQGIQCRRTYAYSKL